MRTTPSHQARKRFGQNFLVDPNIIQLIVATIAPREQDKLVEIGPGQGALTQWLLKACPSMTMVELDRDLIPLLNEKFAQYHDKKIIQGDALEFDFASLAQAKYSLRIVGNLPYNISTPLLFKLLAAREFICDMHFMLQKEVVSRLTATPGDKLYGRLSIMTQYHCQAEWMFDVPPECFKPRPKVDSAIVKIKPHQAIPNIANDVDLLGKIVNLAFQQRRKTLRNALKTLISDEDWSTLNLDPKLRAENLTVKDYVDLANELPGVKNS